MKLKTSRNFQLVIDILRDVKYYSYGEAERTARELFEKVRQNPSMTIEDYLVQIPEKR